MSGISDVLVLNCGSSSVKYSLLEMTGETVLASGLVERIGEDGTSYTRKCERSNRNAVRETLPVHAPDHARAIGHIFEAFARDGIGRPDAIGHRVVHGGEFFREPARIDSTVLDNIRRTVPLAPLHNPINLAGIAATLSHFPALPQVAVFDTAFHQTMPEVAWRYALPSDWHDRHGVRRYGFHGTSSAYVSRQAAKHLGRPLDQCNLILLHLGNGASATAIRAGVSVDTSMGLTPLEGLVMGTRCGDMDPAIPDYMERVVGLTADEIDKVLNRQSGLKALCGDYDMRIILDRANAGDVRARLALDLYSYRIRKYIGAYTAVLGRVDALVFTGGIGEHAAPVREKICAGLEGLGIRLDSVANTQRPGSPPVPAEVHQAGSPVAILVIPTNEELEIARQTIQCLTAENIHPRGTTHESQH